MMAAYSRQHNSDLDDTEDRSLSPTSEVLSDPTGGAVRFVSPSLKYRVGGTSLWRGRTGIEKSLMLIVGVLLVVCLALGLAVVSIRRQEGNINIKLLHPDPSCLENSQNQSLGEEIEKTNETRNIH